MKKMKSFRLSNESLEQLKRIKESYEVHVSEAAIVEAAIFDFYNNRFAGKKKRSKTL